MDVLKDIELQTIKNHFVYAFRKYTRRAGSAAMLEWLENETDFFTAPASAEHHCAYPGGLLIHSLNVYNRLRKITIRDMTTRDAPGGYHLSEEQEETVAVLGLLHDVCKVGVYHKMDPFKDVLENKWAPYMLPKNKTCERSKTNVTANHFSSHWVSAWRNWNRVRNLEHRYLCYPLMQEQ